MSADNWAICPRCKATADKKSASRKLEVAKAYGKIPSDQWMKRKQELETEVRIEETLREDYSLGISADGKFCVHYSAQCQCGFSFRFDHEAPAISGDQS